MEAICIMSEVVNINETRLPIEELHLSFLIHKLRNEYGFMESSRNNIPVNGNGEIMPLYTYPCYEYLRSMDWNGAKVFEYGCGYSTLWWSSQGANIYGVESEQEWANKINPYGKLKNISVETNEKEYVASIRKHKTKFDVIIIDGLARYDCVSPAIDTLKNGGIIILDNSDWHTNTKELLDDNSELIPIHFSGFKPIHVETETTSCYIHRNFKRKSRTLLPMGGTKRIRHEDDLPRE